MAEMYINYGSFDGWASKIKEKNDKLNQDLIDIQTMINSLSGEWESDSASKIREKITGMKTRFEQYYQVVDNYRKFLTNTAQEWRNAEGTNTSNADQFI